MRFHSICVGYNFTVNVLRNSILPLKALIKSRSTDLTHSRGKYKTKTGSVNEEKIHANAHKSTLTDTDSGSNCGKM